MLGSPDVRLRLPRHHAIASWTTPDGRQAAFVAETIPMRVDPARIAAHAAAQQARGAARLTDLAQPHWDSAPASEASTKADHPAQEQEQGDVTRDAARLERTAANVSGDAQQQTPEPEPLPATPADGYRELLELDRASAVRRVPGPASGAASPRELEQLDRRLLEIVGNLGHVLSSQLHRHVNPGRAASTTQRRLRRLAQAGLVERLQMHRSDGGGVPMAYALTAAGEDLVRAQDPGSETRHASGSDPRGDGLAEVRRAIHAAGWSLALAGLTDVAAAHGAHISWLAPPRGASPATLELPGGLVPHDLLRTAPSGERGEAARFETIRPAACVALKRTSSEHPAPELMLDFDDRSASVSWTNRLERYEHFLTGWSELIARYRAPQGPARAFVVFVCRDRRRARECARRADLLLVACRAYPGEHPRRWGRPARERMLFVAERDIHEGSLAAWRVPPLSPELRVEEEDGVPPAAGTALPTQLPVRSRSLSRRADP